ncbi:MAG: DUF192 domain-containing protein [Gammaproteobacteria bacterium]
MITPTPRRTDRRSTLLLLFAVLLPALAACASAPVETQVQLKGQRFTVEVADSGAARERGLMFRTRMAADHGMLFLFASALPRMFWMKHTLIPLDILFFDAQRRLINVSADTPPCKRDPCPTYASAAPAQYVLELNAGTAQQLGIRPGNRLRIRR